MLSLLVVAADIGAQAYANSVPGCTLTTNDVIRSMLNHDARFKQMLSEDSEVAGMDRDKLESAVFLAYRETKEACSRKGTTGKLGWEITPAEPNVPGVAINAHGPSKSVGGNRTIRMIIPGTWYSRESMALQLLYKYWGIPFRHEIPVPKSLSL